MNPGLQQLKDIHLPHAISKWPVGPGWLIVFAILLGVVAYLLWRLYQRQQQKKTVKFAIVKLNQLQTLTSHNPENINIAAEISTLLRRTALYYYRREEIAGLTGKEWLQFLNSSGKTKAFTDQTGQLLIDAPYRKTTTHDLTSLFALAQNWLKTISKKKIED